MRTTSRPWCFSAETVTPPGRTTFSRSNRAGDSRWTRRFGPEPLSLSLVPSVFPRAISIVRSLSDISDFMRRKVLAEKWLRHSLDFGQAKQTVLLLARVQVGWRIHGSPPCGDPLK